MVDFFVKAKSFTIEGFSTNEGFLPSEKTLAKPKLSLSINEGSTNDGFRSVYKIL